VRVGPTDAADPGLPHRNPARPQVVETMHVDEKIDLPNALSLSPEELKHRKVEYLDIAAAQDAKAKDYDAAMDPRSFRSATTGRGRLEQGWERLPATRPLACAYKVVRADFRYFGLQSTVEHHILAQQRELFLKTHANAFCTIDEWHAMSFEDIRRYEESVAKSSSAALAGALAKAADIPRAPVASAGAAQQGDNSSDAAPAAAGAAATAAHG
jgi:hypothetical protein